MKYFLIILTLISFTGFNFIYADETNSVILAESFDFEINHNEIFLITEKQVKYIIPYKIENGIIDDIQLNCHPPSLILSISTTDPGKIMLDLAAKMIGGVHMILVNENNWQNVSIDGNLLTVLLPENTHEIEIRGSYLISSDDGICEIIHNPPYSYILPPLQQFKAGIMVDEIVCKEDLVLIQKYNGAPACVKENTKVKLIERSWTS